MMILWLGFLLVIILGSLYPFTFSTQDATPEAWDALWNSWGWRTSRGDIAGNVLLFVPAGFLGMMAHRKGPYILRACIVCLIAFVVAAGVQVVQVYLPRSATMVDVTWNMVGMLPGLLFFLLPWEQAARRLNLRLDLNVVAVSLIGSYMLYRLWPLLPTIDLSEVKDSLKPLLVDPVFSIEGLITNTAAWTGIAWLMRRADVSGRLDWLLPVLIGGCFLGEIMVVNNTVSLNNVAGAGAALVIWFVALRHLPGRLSALAVALVFTAGIVTDALAPFEFGAPGEFAWMPFSGMLGGSMMANTYSVIDKAFLYGTLVFLWAAVLGSTLIAALPVAGLLLGLEWTQRTLPGRTAEVTDAVLALAAALTIVLISRTIPGVRLGFAGGAAEQYEPAERETMSFDEMKTLARQRAGEAGDALSSAGERAGRAGRELSAKTEEILRKQQAKVAAAGKSTKRAIKARELEAAKAHQAGRHVRQSLRPRQDNPFAKPAQTAVDRPPEISLKEAEGKFTSGRFGPPQTATPRTTKAKTTKENE